MLGLLVAAICMASNASESPSVSLESLFRSASVAKPHTWWHWMAGNVTKSGITADLEAMKFAGIGGAHIFDVGQGIPTGPIAYNSPEWRDLMAHAMVEGQRLGLDMTMHNCSGWSSSGGPWVKPEDAMKRLVWSKVSFEGPGHPAVPLPKPETTGGYYQDVAVWAFPTPQTGQTPDLGAVRSMTGLSGSPGESPNLDWPVVSTKVVLDLTKSMSADGRLTANLPTGSWTILRLGATLTGSRNVASRPTGEGYEVDKLSKASLDRFIKGGLEPLIARIGAPVGHAFSTVLVDSYETGFQNWTPGLLEDFRRLRGYSAIPYLPALTGYVVNDQETTRRFLYDYRRTLSELWSTNYSGHFSNRLAKMGLQLAIEPYGNGNIEPFTYAKPAGLIMGEYWVGDGQINGSVKQASSIAHIYGKKVVGAEALTATPSQAGWRNQPRQWKAFADRGFTYGINRIIYHRFAHQPWPDTIKPGMTMGPWGSHVDRTQTFWSFMPQWNAYLARCQSLLQQGVFVADVLLFAGEESPQQYIGEGSQLPNVPVGYDFDFCGASPLMACRVEGGKIVSPGGTSYRVLVLPNNSRMTVATAKKIEKLVEAGATVLGPKPNGSPSLAEKGTGDREVQRIGRCLWNSGNRGTKKTGRGIVYSGYTVEELLNLLKVVPDFSSDSSRTRAIHRNVDKTTDLYFVAAFDPYSHSARCTFRVTGKIPELWNPETGQIVDAPVWNVGKGVTHVEIPFETDGSVFVVFRRPVGRAVHATEVSVTSTSTATSVEKPLRIIKAVYGVLADPEKSKDVTRLVAGLVRHGGLQLVASNDDLGGDPAFNFVKALKVDYEFDGKRQSVVVGENELLSIVDVQQGQSFPRFVTSTSSTGLEVIVMENGILKANLSDGRVIRKEIDGIPEPSIVGGSWEVRFPYGSGVPNAVQMKELQPWTEHPDFDVQHFSGTGTYVKRLKVPATFLEKGHRLYLDFGDVRELARIRLNGKLIRSFWKPPFSVDITDYAKVGDNVLQVEVTNMWVNRLIGDEYFPDDVGWNGQTLRAWPDWLVEGKPRPEVRRKTFTTWRHNTKDTALMRSGILGPVQLRVGKVVDLR